MEQIIATIAKEHLSFDTPETRRSDSLDQLGRYRAKCAFARQKLFS